jgi:hypothetical protein
MKLMTLRSNRKKKEGMAATEGKEKQVERGQRTHSSFKSENGRPVL